MSSSQECLVGRLVPGSGWSCAQMSRSEDCLAVSLVPNFGWTMRQTSSSEDCSAGSLLPSSHWKHCQVSTSQDFQGGCAKTWWLMYLLSLSPLLVQALPERWVILGCGTMQHTDLLERKCKWVSQFFPEFLALLVFGKASAVNPGDVKLALQLFSVPVSCKPSGTPPNPEPKHWASRCILHHSGTAHGDLFAQKHSHRWTSALLLSCRSYLGLRPYKSLKT